MPSGTREVRQGAHDGAEPPSQELGGGGGCRGGYLEAPAEVHPLKNDMQGRDTV